MPPESDMHRSFGASFATIFDVDDCAPRSICSLFPLPPCGRVCLLVVTSPGRSNQEVVDFVRKKRRKTRNLTKICESILDAIIAEPSDTTGNGRDNCTIRKGPRARARVCVCVWKGDGRVRVTNSSKCPSLCTAGSDYRVPRTRVGQRRLLQRLWIGLVLIASRWRCTEAWKADWSASLVDLEWQSSAKGGGMVSLLSSLSLSLLSRKQEN